MSDDVLDVYARLVLKYDHLHYKHEDMKIHYETMFREIKTHIEMIRDKTGDGAFMGYTPDVNVHEHALKALEVLSVGQPYE